MPTKDELTVAIELVETRQFAAALKILEPLVEREVPRALTTFASVLLFGHGVEEDIPRAVRMLERAAELGDALAALNLGSVYMSGAPGVPVTPAESKRYYDLALRLGVDPAWVPPTHRARDS